MIRYAKQDSIESQYIKNQAEMNRINEKTEVILKAWKHEAKAALPLSKTASTASTVASLLVNGVAMDVSTSDKEIPIRLIS
ncbi:MAG: hypothetical protein EZS28_023051 [Streblomastix strix]|uniref:Uncharacterized protein n=1 Tax=Streblomastix strix TaxID=222440 RepID=A0A5J4VGB2_9EUKA|nr:MAG: hypothetical protein EZS28_023051 [Streblomastix strix]